METKWVKRRTYFSKLFIFLVIIFLIIATILIGATIWVKWSLSAPDPAAKEKVFVIKQDESIKSISERLKTEGLIKDSQIFRWYISLSCSRINFLNPVKIIEKKSNTCFAKDIQAGSFKLSGKMDMVSLIKSLKNGRLDTWVRVIEGLRNEEIASLMEKNLGIRQEDFLAKAKIGYMFPDTYLFRVNATAGEVSDKMQATFALKLTADLQDKIKTQGLTVDEGVILASILERESKDTDERSIVAGILLRRLREGIPLGVDATIQYALGYDSENKTWWRKTLTDQDLSIESLFNTRAKVGLPPTPICNPGLSALKAVGNAQDKGYYYYLHGKDGKIHYAKTLQEHNNNKILYL